MHQPAGEFIASDKKNERKKEKLTSYVSALYIVHKRGRDFITLAVLMAVSFLPTLVLISVREARFWLCVGCGSP